MKHTILKALVIGAAVFGLAAPAIAEPWHHHHRFHRYERPYRPGYVHRPYAPGYVYAPPPVYAGPSLSFSFR